MGNIFREWMEVSGMVAANTADETGKTYYSQSSVTETRIDYLYAFREPFCLFVIGIANLRAHVLLKAILKVLKLKADGELKHDGMGSNRTPWGPPGPRPRLCRGPTQVRSRTHLTAV